MGTSKSFILNTLFKYFVLYLDQYYWKEHNHEYPKAFITYNTSKEKLVKFGMAQAVVIHRAKILLLKADVFSNDSVAEELGINKRAVLLWTQKYRSCSADETLDDIFSVFEGKGPKEEIFGETKTWIIGIACQKPKDLGYAVETWMTRR